MNDYSLNRVLAQGMKPKAFTTLGALFKKKNVQKSQGCKNMGLYC